MAQGADAVTVQPAEVAQEQDGEIVSHDGKTQGSLGGPKLLAAELRQGKPVVEFLDHAFHPRPCVVVAPDLQWRDAFGQAGDREFVGSESPKALEAVLRREGIRCFDLANSRIRYAMARILRRLRQDGLLKKVGYRYR